MSKKEPELNMVEYNDLAFCAFRYALGRMTYITKTVSDILIKMNQKGLLTYWTKEQMIKELEDAIENNKAGMNIDKQYWQALLTELTPNIPGKD